MAQSGAGTWDPGMRAGDADRERLVEQLREHHAAGRLTIEEFEERMGKAYGAKTFGELSVLTRDLPIDLAKLGPGADAAARYKVKSPGDEVREALMGVRDHLYGERGALRIQRETMRAAMRAQRRGRLAHRVGWQRSLGSWLSVSVLLTGIWLLSNLSGGGGWSNFWPAWPIGIWGLVLLMGKINGHGRR